MTMEPTYRVPVERRMEFLPLAQEAGMWPYFRRVESEVGPAVVMDGGERLMFGSNNYLGLTADPRVKEAAKQAVDDYGTGLTGSRLLNGTIPLHTDLERELAEWFGTEDALVFTTGYQANLGALTGMVGRGDRVICDAADHASLIDGANLSGAELRSYRHDRLDRLGRVLARDSEGSGQTLVAVDGVYSGDGAVCDLRVVADLCDAHGAQLLVDEAHAVGVVGERGAGAAELLGVEPRVTLRTGTFSKSLASCGGFAAGGGELLERVRFQARPLLFSASAVPAALGAALAALRIARSPEGREMAARVRANVKRLRAGLEELGFVLVDQGPGVTPIIAVDVGDELKAMSLWKELFDAGVYVNVFMYPAARPGKAMLRMSVMAAHEEGHVDAALDVFRGILAEAEPGYFVPEPDGA